MCELYIYIYKGGVCDTGLHIFCIRLTKWRFKKINVVYFLLEKLDLFGVIFEYVWWDEGRECEKGRVSGEENGL